MKKACKHILPGYALLFSVFLLVLLSAGSLFAQKKSVSPDFNKVDSFVLAINYQNDFIKLARDLATPFPQDLLKVRAIFKWITNNIEYDYQFANTGKELLPPDCEGEYDCNETTRSWENNYIKRILKSKKAIYDGYSRLFQKLCEINHIQSQIIPGYVRTKPYQIGNKISANHSWNAVYIDSAWFFLDVTWAAGYVIENEETEKLVKFVKDYREYYWLTPFKRLARNHFPKNEYWGYQYQLSLPDFFNMPHYYSVDVLEHISNENPSTGVLSVKKSDTVHFSFDCKKNIRYIQLNTNNFRNPSLWTTVAISKRKTQLVKDTWAEKKQVYIPFVKKGNQYRFDYVVTDQSTYFLELVFDYKKAIRYKITVNK